MVCLGTIETNILLVKLFRVFGNFALVPFIPFPFSFSLFLFPYLSTLPYSDYTVLFQLMVELLLGRGVGAMPHLSKIVESEDFTSSKVMWPAFRESKLESFSL